jgi:hypothetical protein
MPRDCGTGYRGYKSGDPSLLLRISRGVCFVLRCCRRAFPCMPENPLGGCVYPHQDARPHPVRIWSANRQEAERLLLASRGSDQAFTAHRSIPAIGGSSHRQCVASDTRRRASMLASAFSHLAFHRVRNAESVGAIASSASAMNFGARLQRPREWVRRWRLRPGMKRRRWPRRRGVRSPGFVWRACALIALALTDLLAASAGAWSCRRKVSGPLSRNDVSAVAPWHRVSRAMSRRLDDVSTAPWRYVSGPLARNNIGTIAAWDCISRPMSRRLYNIALRLSRAD